MAVVALLSTAGLPWVPCHEARYEMRIRDYRKNIDQPEAQLSQKVALPAGDYLFNATALTRSNYTSHIFAGEQTERLVRVTRSTASDLDQARAWFDQGNGQNSLAFSLTEAGDIELGIRADLTHGDHWTVWSDFRLVMVGKPVKPTVNDSQYKAALAAIHSGKKYRIFTTYDGKQFTDTRHYLTREGVLNGSVFIMSPEAVGYETCAYIGLNLKNPEDFDHVVEELKKIPEVTECHYTTGDFDMFIKIYAHNNHHLLTLIHDRLQPLGLRSTQTLISFHSAFERQLPVGALLGED